MSIPTQKAIRETEQRIVRGLIRHMNANGWKCDRVHDGGDADEVATTEETMMLHAFGVDCATLWFRNDAGADHGVFIVCGNGTDIISDWSYAKGDPDAFDKLMNEYMDTLS